MEHIFIGSCTNSRIEDLRAAAAVLRGRHVADGIKQAMVVPGSGLVKRQADTEGLDRIFTEAGFEWREPGCSACLGMNPDKVPPGEPCASTSNRNFTGRQGPGARTHLLSPRWPPPRRSPDASPTCANWSRRESRAAHRRRGHRLSARPCQRRHRPDYRRQMAEDDHPHRARPRRVRHAARRRQQRVRRSRLRRQPDPDRGRQLRVRLQPRTRRLGARRPRGAGRDRAELLRHLRRQRVQERPARRGPAAGRGRSPPRRRPPRAAPDRPPTPTRHHPAPAQLPFPIDPFRKQCLLGGTDEIGLSLASADAIVLYEETRPSYAGMASRFSSRRPGDRPRSTGSARAGGRSAAR